jgi:hypothetical protein
MSKLAIVIPAYKDIYFEKTLLSIAVQTCKDFTLYIGDDSSPFALKPIIDLFKNKIKIVYKRFDVNVGNLDLVAQWERCIDMVQDEEWIWLFSDDDIMDRNCVKYFYQAISDYPDFDLFHFNVHIINHEGSIISSFNFPELLTSEQFFSGRNQLGYHSYVVEYIFRKSHFLEMGRFDNFDLGWGSDDALWIKLGVKKGIKTIDNAKVFWRRSQHNISSNSTDKKILRRKLYAKIEYSSWALRQAKENYIQIDIVKIQNQLEKAFLEDIKVNSENLSFKMITEYINRFYNLFNKTRFVKLKLIFLYINKIYRYFKTIFRKLLYFEFCKDSKYYIQL